MPVADPVDGADAYEILGVSEQATFEEIDQAYDTLVAEYKQKYATARKTNDTELGQQVNEALGNIDEAYDWLVAHHEPPVIDQSASVAVDPTTATVGQSVTIAVTSNGQPVADAVVNIDRAAVDPDNTDRTGETTVTFQRAGTATVTVPTTDQYSDATTTVTVERQSQSLGFGGVPNTASVGQQLTIAVGTNELGPVSNTTVSLDGTPIGTTDSNGEVTHRFEHTGTYKLTAEKDPTDQYTFETAHAQLTIEPETVPLKARLNTDPPRAGRPVVVEVAEPDDTRVEDAQVDVSGGATATTNSGGTAEVRLPEQRSVTISIDKPTGDAADRVFEGTTIRVRPDKRQDAIDLSIIEGTPIEGGTITLQATDSQGSPLSDVQITSTRGHETTTDTAGEATIEFADGGPIELSAEKQAQFVSYQPATERLDIEEYVRQLRFAECPNAASPGETIDVRITDQHDDPISSAEIRTNRRIAGWETNADGWAAVDLADQPGIARLTATKTDDDVTTEKAIATLHVRG